MKTITRIPAWRTLVNWIAVVLLGSVIAPAFLGHWDVNAIGFFILASGICSIPALILFLFINEEMNSRQLSPARYRMKQGLIHLLIAVLTFASLSNMLLPGLAVTLSVGGTYTLLGQLAWWITFSSHREHIPAAPATSNHQNNQV